MKNFITNFRLIQSKHFSCLNANFAMSVKPKLFVLTRVKTSMYITLITSHRFSEQ